MRKLIVTENMSLDGVIEATGGWCGPTEDKADTDGDDSDIVATLRERMEA